MLHLPVDQLLLLNCFHFLYTNTGGLFTCLIITQHAPDRIFLQISHVTLTPTCCCSARCPPRSWWTCPCWRLAPLQTTHSSACVPASPAVCMSTYTYRCQWKDNSKEGTCETPISEHTYFLSDTHKHETAGTNGLISSRNGSQWSLVTQISW